VVSVLATLPKGHRFEPGWGDWFLRMIRMHSTPCFRWKVKLEAPYHKILRRFKHLLTYLRYWYAKFLLLCTFLLLTCRCLWW
jgi:hypothetical protein